MEQNNLIDESGTVPSIKDWRINIFDCMAALKSADPHYQMVEVWGLSEEEMENLKQYVEENEEELLQLMDEQTPPKS